MWLRSCRRIIGHRNTVQHSSALHCAPGDVYVAVQCPKRFNASQASNNPSPIDSPLSRHLYSKIMAGGAITVADFMKEVLTSPNAGYYMNRDVFGTEGDFTTSPEISQLFGEMIAIWSINEWRKISDRPIQLVELGPGRGTLSRDILRVYEKLGVCDKVSLHLVEISPMLSKVQANLLCKEWNDINEDKVSSTPWYKEGIMEKGVKVFWYHSIYDVPKTFSIIIAHEFFDALPIHKFQKTPEGWREILIDIDPMEGAGQRFRYVLARSATPSSKFYICKDEIREHVETSPQSAVLIDYVAKFLVENGGFALIADYGHDGDRTDTFRAFHQHKQQDPLLNPGTADLTADVDFSLLKRIACQEGRLLSYGPVTQRHFLKKLGIDTRLAMLMKNAEESSKNPIISGYRMITDKDKMGHCFKFLSLFPSVLKEHLQRFPVVGF
ncbi:protein arginine methyltransferase NDUFAF7 homolog, mitochondrial [Athalia rosae]|uniref:protein arginine methyltransferase NDUFAF7 homolog, mitochondrial n=1 Tax=Athalia rosae TaxID=37344 RepID=UPI002033C3EB|nr:protein arginine methyltransferase NDUFAF7 homolog, mitochondrial [Athalia rosae]